MGLQHKKHQENGFLKIKRQNFLKANDFWKKNSPNQP
jgi:hypothetical protein